jgi:tripartite ATP-independent transporter DctP family solute receptor
MKKLAMALLVVLTVGALVHAAGSAETVEQKPIVIKVSNHVSPETAQTIGLFAARDYIAEKTNGRVDLQVYHSGQLSPQNTIIVDTQSGAIDMCLAGPSMMGQYYKPITILGAPYLYRNMDHMYKVVNSDLVKPLFEGFEKDTRLKILDYWALGVRNVSSKTRATNPQEFSAIKMRAPNAPMYITAVRALGANPTPIAVNETYLALQTGTVDAQENPLNFIMSMKFHEVQKYIILTEHMVDSFAIVINQDKWNSIPADLQKIVVDGIKHGRAKSDEVIINGDQLALEEFRKAGLEIVTVSKDIFVSRAQAGLKDFEQDWPAGLFQRIVNF